MITLLPDSEFVCVGGGGGGGARVVRVAVMRLMNVLAILDVVSTNIHHLCMYWCNAKHFGRAETTPLVVVGGSHHLCKKVEHKGA